MQAPMNLFCRLTLAAVFLIAQAMGLARAQNLAAKDMLTMEDFKLCRAEIEESYNLHVAEFRARMASRAQEMHAYRDQPKSLKWRKEKQESDQRYLDYLSKNGPAVGTFQNELAISLTRAEVVKEIKRTQRDMHLLKTDPEGEEIRSTVGVTFTKEAAAVRIAYDEARICLFKVRLAKLDAKTPAVSAAAANGRVAAMGGKKDPFPKVGEGGPNDPTPVPAPRPGNDSPGLGKGIIAVPLPKLSSAQVSACSEEIRRTQLASQGWDGDANQVAARLGRFQKDLFEGRCAGHPEAAAYIAGADKMLSYTQAGSSGTNPGGGTGTIAAPAGSSGGLSGGAQTFPPGAPGGKQHNAAHSAKDCVAVYHEREMKALGYKNIMRSIIVNTCTYPVSVQWCVEAGNGGAGDCKPGYSNLADLVAKGTRGIDSNYQAVRYAACRHGPGMGFLPVVKNPSDPFRFACS